MPRNPKAVGSAPDQTETFPGKSLVHLLAVVVGRGGGVGVVGASLTLCLHALCGPLCVCSYDQVRLVGGLVICKTDLVQ